MNMLKPPYLSGMDDLMWHLLILCVTCDLGCLLLNKYIICTQCWYNAAQSVASCVPLCTI